jgi:transcriptional regulator
MYQPEPFRLTDPATIHALVRAHPLAQVVTHGPGGLMANLVPMRLHVGADGSALLRAHFARPNAQWREIAAGADLLLSFQGVQRYITPAWYETKKPTGKVVPTWNYVTVQARGPARIIEEAGWLHAHLVSLTEVHEGARAEPWAVEDAPEAYIAALMRGIVGFEMRVEAWDAKMKVSQNRPEADRRGVFEGLAASGEASAGEMAALLAPFLERPAP